MDGAKLSNHLALIRADKSFERSPVAQILHNREFTSLAILGKGCRVQTASQAVFFITDEPPSICGGVVGKVSVCACLCEICLSCLACDTTA